MLATLSPSTATTGEDMPHKDLSPVRRLQLHHKRRQCLRQQRASSQGTVMTLTSSPLVAYPRFLHAHTSRRRILSPPPPPPPSAKDIYYVILNTFLYPISGLYQTPIEE